MRWRRRMLRRQRKARDARFKRLGALIRRSLSIGDFVSAMAGPGLPTREDWFAK